MKHPNNGILCNYIKKNKVGLHSPTLENLQDIMLLKKKEKEKRLRTGLRVHHSCFKQTLYFHVYLYVGVRGCGRKH